MSEQYVSDLELELAALRTQVEELKKTNTGLAIASLHEYSDAEARLATATAALELYAVRENYLHNDGECPPICEDEGDAARAALDSIKSEAVSTGEA